MQLTFTIPDDAIDALSAQFESRTPRKRDPDDPKVFTEAAADHVARALDVWVNQELDAARKIAADAAVAAAKDDTTLSAALLAKHKLAMG